MHAISVRVALRGAHSPLAMLLQEMYKKIAWPLYRIYGHAFEAMKTIVTDDGVSESDGHRCK